MNVTVDVPDDDIRTALSEAGIAYWAAVGPSDEDDIENLCVVAHNDSTDSADWTTFKLDLARGLRFMARSRWGLDVSNWDAATKDAFVQYAAFGELVYG